MAEDMTYAPVTDWRQRAQELERENAELRGTLNLIPEYIRYCAKWRVADGAFLLFNEWVAQRVQAEQPDDTDAPLKLAALDEDGDE